MGVIVFIGGVGGGGCHLTLLRGNVLLWATVAIVRVNVYRIDSDSDQHNRPPSKQNSCVWTYTVPVRMNYGWFHEVATSRRNT